MPSNNNKIAIFLDRDGVINRYPGDTKYVTSWRKFHFLPNAKKAIALLNTKRYPVIVISNQAGVSKGLYTQGALDEITQRMRAELQKSNASIDRVYYCTHRDEDQCSCRKPKTGLLKRAVKEKGVNPKRSFFIGDTIRDIDTAKAAGCKSILVLSGKEKLTNRNNWQTQPDFIFKNLYEAAKFIVSQDMAKEAIRQLG